MILGIDAGGTNVDVVAIDEGKIVRKEKVPNNGIRESIEDALTSIRADWSTVEVSHVVVATTIVVNAAVQKRLPDCTTLLIPGPGLAPKRSFYGDENEVLPGCVDHRGRITEEVRYEGSPETPVVAIVSKFATRNPDLEREVSDSVSYDDDDIALGNESGAGLTFPERAVTTTANAKTRPVFAAFQNDLSAALDSVGIDAPLYYLKGDGAMLGESTIRRAPAHTLRCGAAASTVGLLALTDAENTICVDIGGTTTDVAKVTDGFLDVDRSVRQGEIHPVYKGVTSRSLPIGGDTRIERGSGGLRFTDQREGDAASFGGVTPTLTDALHVIEDFTEGDVDAAQAAFEEIADDAERAARSIIDRYVERVADTIDEIACPEISEIVVGGVLAPALAERITERSACLDQWTVPDDADVAGAIGCAVARVSLEVEIHVDSHRGVLTVASIGPEVVEDIEEGKTFTDEEVTEMATEKIREATRAAGGDPESSCEILTTNRFNVVHHRRVVGEIIDVRARPTPDFKLLDTGES